MNDLDKALYQYSRSDFIPSICRDISGRYKMNIYAIPML